MAMNFRSGTGKLADIFAGIDSAEDQGEARTVYLGSIDIPSHFDGLDTANPIDLGAREPYKSIWIGTRTRIAAHNDFPDNLACCAVGRRRFTLFRSEEHTSELQSLMRISYAVFCLKQKKTKQTRHTNDT